MSPSDQALLILVLGIGSLIVVLLNDLTKSANAPDEKAISHQEKVAESLQTKHKGPHQLIFVFLFLVATFTQAYLAGNPQKAGAVRNKDWGSVTPLVNWLLAPPLDRHSRQPQKGVEHALQVEAAPARTVHSIEEGTPTDRVERVAEKPRNPKSKYLDDDEP